MKLSLLNTKAKNNNVTYDEVIKRYGNFKKQARKNDSRTKRVVQKPTKIVRGRK